MKWIKDQDGDFVNVDRTLSIFVEDRGEEYTKRFSIVAKYYSDDITIFEFIDEKSAQLKMQEIIDQISKPLSDKDIQLS